MSEETQSFPILIVPVFHLLICFIIDSAGTGGSWDWFLMSFVDFPVFLAIGRLHITATPFVTFGVLGTLWWLAISLLFRAFYRRMVL